jgi:Nitrile hydratase beta subunit, C-terminal
VLVLDLGKSGHIRTPFYIRGHVGTVLHRCGAFLNPEDLSIGIVAGPVIPLYRVGFPLNELWTEYRGNPADTLCIEIYDHWLEMSEASDGRTSKAIDILRPTSLPKSE